MKVPQLFLSPLSKDQKEFLNLLELTAKVHGELRPVTVPGKDPIWDENFFKLQRSKTWQSLGLHEQKEVLHHLSEKILQEVFFIENAGMAYAGKMNLTARSRDERQFYCFVAEEEAKHLRMVESLSNFNKSLEAIPSFALLIGEIIQEARTPSLLLLIQILLEGWGLSYYKTLAKESRDENVAAVFKAILKDEIRHHSAGVILFPQYSMTSQDEAQLLGFLERIGLMIKIGPYTVCEEIFRRQASATKEELKTFLDETDAVTVTTEKLELIRQLLTKSLPKSLLERINEQMVLKPLSLLEMTDLLFQSMPGVFQQG